MKNNNHLVSQSAVVFNQTKSSCALQTPLEKLLAIDGWGKRNFSGNFFSVKFRVPKHHADGVAKIKAKHPETLVHFTKNDYIIFGGQYSKTGSFLFDVKTFVKIKVE